MKKIVCWVLIWAMMMGATAACAEEHEHHFVTQGKDTYEVESGDMGDTTYRLRHRMCECGETQVIEVGAVVRAHNFQMMHNHDCDGKYYLQWVCTTCGAAPIQRMNMADATGTGIGRICY